jgi:chromosome segregation ATPase
MSHENLMFNFGQTMASKPQFAARSISLPTPVASQQHDSSLFKPSGNQNPLPTAANTPLNTTSGEIRYYISKLTAQQQQIATLKKQLENTTSTGNTGHAFKALFEEKVSLQTALNHNTEVLNKLTEQNSRSQALITILLEEKITLTTATTSANENLRVAAEEAKRLTRDNVRLILEQNKINAMLFEKEGILNRLQERISELESTTSELERLKDEVASTKQHKAGDQKALEEEIKEKERIIRVLTDDNLKVHKQLGQSKVANGFKNTTTIKATSPDAQAEVRRNTELELDAVESRKREIELARYIYTGPTMAELKDYLWKHHEQALDVILGDLVMEMDMKDL